MRKEKYYTNLQNRMKCEASEPQGGTGEKAFRPQKCSSEKYASLNEYKFVDLFAHFMAVLSVSHRVWLSLHCVCNIYIFPPIIEQSHR